MASLPNTAEMEKHAQEAEMVSNSLYAYDVHTIYLSHVFLFLQLKAANLGIERFEYSKPNNETQNSVEDDNQGIGGNLAVYNPVDENYSSWNNENNRTTDNNDNDASSDDEISVEMVLPPTIDASAIDEHIDINDPEVIESQRRQLSQIEASKKGSSGETTTSMDDDVLAQAIAEQDLPPGVNAVEQQEIMMRLLTQQLRRGDWDDSDISPALEQRLRDFQFAQKKRREKFGNERPYGILGLYDHLGKLVCFVLCQIGTAIYILTYFNLVIFKTKSAGIRLDVEWAEDAAWRRAHKEPYLSWSDFNKTHDHGWNRPFFTYILLVVCTAVLVASYGINGWRIEPLSVNPMIGPSAETLLKMGAKQTSLIVNQGEWYRLFSPMVLHAGLIHYFLNMT